MSVRGSERRRVTETWVLYILSPVVEKVGYSNSHKEHKMSPNSFLNTSPVTAVTALAQQKMSWRYFNKTIL